MTPKVFEGKKFENRPFEEVQGHYLITYQN